MKSVEHSENTIDPSRPVKEVTCRPSDDFNEKYINLSADAKTEISEATSLQCSTLWSDALKLRISLSKVHALPKTSRADPNKFVTNPIYTRFKGNSATQHGQKYEAEARAWFEQNTGLKVIQQVFSSTRLNHIMLQVHMDFLARTQFLKLSAQQILEGTNSRRKI
ncbi:hypothetical protein DPMN_138087 [Dreissena polymorpha]|uniref:YqaJ viral recombinase domain-containing protein n=1 Tax=Dreissena polymorpha TaxID=45954 RepID=A0A9D4G6G6_DREPO|nr:hypothetical protein DPMN_138087 [Dreissena polymorpha]